MVDEYMSEECGMNDDISGWCKTAYIWFQPLVFCFILYSVHFLTLDDLICEKYVYMKCEISVYE